MAFRDFNSPVVDIITGEMIDPKNYDKAWYSASLIQDYGKCPAKAYARITKQKQLNFALPLVNGSAAHWGMESWLKERKDPIKAYNDYFRTECEKQGQDPKIHEKKRLEGEHMMAVAWEQFKNPNFLDKVDPNLVEAGFRIGRDGRIFVGKLDLIFFKEPKRYNIIDFKSGAKPPSPEKLFTDVQFNMYPWATFHDPSLPTNGIWPEYATWFHLQGEVTETRTVNHRDGTTSQKKVEKPEKGPDTRKRKFDFKTVPTPESVEKIFRDTIDPVCEDIEAGRWRRTRDFDSPMGCTGCTMFNKKTGDCGVQLPNDGLAERGGIISLLDRADIGSKAA